MIQERLESDLTAAKPFAALFAERRSALPGAALAWLARRREAALAAFAHGGIPTQQAEAWRKTPLLRALAKLSPALPEAVPLGLDRAPRLVAGEADRLVFADGLYHPELSQRSDLAVGCHLDTLAALLMTAPEQVEALLEEEPAALGAFARLNLALFQDGVVLDLAPGARLSRPLELTFLSGFAGGLANPRLQISLGAEAEAVVVEQHLGLGPKSGFDNHVGRIALADGAKLLHIVVLAEGAEARHLAETHVTVARDARYESFVLFGGGSLVRRELAVTLAGRGATTLVNGAYLLRGSEHGDLLTDINHAAPDTTSRETVKGALAEASRQVFQGRITVEPGASRADGRMANKTLLLSDKAEIDTKPELRIFHDDVQCAHGATSGKLDAGALFYLRSRGLPETVARRLLIASFLAETLEGLSDPTLSQTLAERIEARLQEIAP